MFTSPLTLRSKVLIRLTLLLAAGCLLGALLSNFTASASSSEPGLLRRFFTAPVTTVQQVFGRAKSLAAAPVLVPAAPAMAATITVNSLADTVADDGTCTLREAITSANNNTASGAMAGECAAGMAGLDNIVFNLAAGTPSIALTGVLPNIIVGEPININGNTGASTRVELNCTLVPAGLNGLTIFAGSSTIQSLVINRLPDKDSKAIYIATNGGNTIKNCYIGTNAAGTAISANGGDAVFINNVPDNIVGGTTAAERNVLSGNGTLSNGNGNGVGILGCDPADPTCVQMATGNKVLGNYLGTDVTGMIALPNIENGVVIRHGADNIVDRNLISGNGFDGIFIQAPQSTGNKVTGNFIGVNVTGTAALGNKNDGVLLSNAPDNIIGGTTAAERNIISGNGVVGNGNRGVWIFNTKASGNKIIGNYIGTDVTGTIAIPNNDHGVWMQDAPNNYIGGTTAAEANIVAGNLKVGVRVIPNVGLAAKGNKILGNSIFGNGLRGIALSVSNFPVPNDALDVDTGDDPTDPANLGGNNLQNYPVLSCAVSGVGTTTIKGTLNSLATTNFRVEFFSNDACHAVGNGEGKTYLGFQNVTTDAAGNATINAAVAATVAAGKFITSTATKLGVADAPVETSEFSTCQIVTTAPTLAINNVTQIEGNAGPANFVFTVTLSAQSSCGDVTVSYATADGSATTANNDYTATTGLLTFSGATLTQTITVPVIGDLVAELDEAFVVNLSNASGAGITTAQGIGTITNDDTGRILAISDATVTEGDSGTVNATFNVTLSAPHTAPITVDYQTADGTANTPSDYAALALTTLTFNIGETTKPVTVVVNGDTTVEGNETFFVNLSNASGATIADAQGVGTITNDDSTTIAINDIIVAEGDSGTVNAGFNVTLSKPSATPVTVQYQTADGTATAPSDYAALALTTLTFNIGETTKPVTVVVNGDMTVEPNETFFVNLSNASGATIADAQGIGTISNDDATTVAINDVTVAEGDSGTVNASFNVTLSKPSATAVTVQYQTADNTATAPSDYLALALTTLTFNAGETTKPVTVVVNGDTTVEATETFFVNLSNASGATIADAQGIGTISNDDAATIAINDVTVAEGDSGTVNATFNVTLSKPSATAVTVQYQTADNTATTPSDYLALALTTLTFNPGETTKPVTVVVNGEVTVEPNETFFVNLSNPSGATIADAQGIGTITNDDTAKTLAINDVTVAEGDSGTVNAVFNVTLNVPATAPITVQYQTADNSATAPSDYAALALTTLTFNIGETTKPVTVVVNGDTTVEGNETFFVNLSNASGASITDAQGIGTITNDDSTTIAINDVTVAEGDSGTVNATFNVTLSKPSATAVTVQYQTADNSATAPSDYTALALATLTFNAGETTKPVTVVVNGDLTSEATETFFVNLSNASGATIADAQGIGTITNDDTAKTLAINDVTVAEGDSGTVNATFNVTLNVPATAPITVQYQTADNSATAPSDYAALALTTLTFNIGETTKPVTVVVNGDTTVEGNETFFVNLSNASGATIADAQGIGTITNDDSTTIAINDIIVAEGDSGTVNAGFNVTLSKPSATPVTVQYQTADGTATAPSDYAALALTTLTFNIGETTKPVTVVVNGDMTVEPNETFFVNLSNASGATIADAQGIGTISNDDATTVAINDVTVAEGDSGTVNASFNVTLSKPSATAVTVQYQTADNTATAPSDYLALALTTLTFNAGETTKPVTVVVNGDMTVEATETFFVNLSNASGATIADAQGIGTISNDDAATIAINDVTVAEGDSGTVNAGFNVTLSKPSATAVTVQYQTADNTATAPSDYLALALTTLTFNPGETTKPVTVVVNGEVTVEPNETFFVNLSNPSGATIADAQGIGTITNDDTAKTLAINDVTVAEGDSGTVNAVFNVTLNVPATAPITVQYQTADNSATAPSDYAALALTTLTFNIGETTKPVTVVVNGDTTVEGNETFFVNLSNASGASITDAQGIGTITNDDSTTIAINDVTVAEGDSGTVNATFNVTLSKPSATAVTVQYQTADNSATAPSDYTALALATLTFNAGETTKPVTVVVNGDLTSEATETFFVNLSNASGATIADAQGIGTITNDDTAKTLAINDVTVAEGDSGTVNATFNVTLNVPATAPITVQYQTADNSATAPSDYAALALTTLTFNIGETTKPVTVVVNGDTTVEGNETFFVNLSNASGATINDAQGVGTITNDDATTIAINDVTVAEGDSGTVNATFNVTLSKPSATAVTVQYQTADNSATAPSDYAALALTTLTFNAGETTKPVTVVVNGDMTVEPNETFFVNLSNASGATIADAQGIGTITNDDSTTVAINDVTVTEGNSGTVSASFNVTFSKASAEQVTVTYTAANGTATTGDNDYAAASGTVIFAAGETSKPVVVTVNGDTKVEATETFNVNLSNIVGNNVNVPDPTMLDALGVGTITNDDAATVAINDVTVTEGHSGTVNASFAVSLSAPVDQPVVVNYATANGTATTANGDYAAATGTVTFAAGSTAAQTITVIVNGDTNIEPDETFVVNLTPNSLPYAGVTIADAQGLGTIKTDDFDKTPSLNVAMNDPFVCNGIGSSVQVTAQLNNPFPSAQAATFSVTLPSMLTALPGTCMATTGNCTITLPNQIAWVGTLNPDQTVTITYQVQIADGTPDGQLIVINSKGTVNGVEAKASASGTVSCPANNLNSPPTDVDVSAQKPGSVLVYPYYTSKSGTKADTRIQLSNVGKAQIIAHLFFVDGTSCQQSDMFICLTPDASFFFKASEYDPEVTGWFMVVAVDTNGHPTQNNGLIGSAFVQEGDYVDSYGAEAFRARSGNLATVTANTALLRFDGAGYDPMPNQFAVELQSPLDTVGQRIVTVGLSGDLTTSRMTGAGQLGLGLVYNGNENPFGSFGSFLVGNCQAIATISTANPRVPGAMSKMIPSGQVGTMKFNIGAGVGLMLTPRTSPNKWSGIRALHKTNTTFSTIRIPVFTPQC